MSREFILFGGKISRKRKKMPSYITKLDGCIRWSRFSCLHALEEKGTLARGNISCWDISLTMWLYIYWQFSSNCKRNAPGEVICTSTRRVSFHFFGTLRFWRFCYLTLASSSTDAEKLYSTRPRKAEQDAEIRRERGEYRYRESYRELETLKQINDDK